MKIRLMGLPAEVNQAVEVFRGMPGIDVIEVDGPYPNRGGSRMVRVYIETRLLDQGGDAP